MFFPPAITFHSFPPISFLQETLKLILKSLVVAATQNRVTSVACSQKHQKQSQTAESFFTAAALTERRLVGLIKTFARHLKPQQTADKIDPGSDKKQPSKFHLTVMAEKIQKKKLLLFTDGIVAHLSSKPGGAALWLSPLKNSDPARKVWLCPPRSS